MATLTRITAGELASTNNVTSYPGPAFTPTAGRLLGVLVMASINGGASGTLTGSANGLTFTRAANGTANTRRFAVFLADQLTPSSPTSMTVTWATNDAAGSGCFLFPFEVAGMTKTGAAALLQAAAGIASSTAGSTPTVSLPVAPQSGNPVVGMLMDGANPAAVTPPSGFTEGADTGHSGPVTGGEYAFRNSGHTSAAVTWGATVASVAQTFAFELDASGTSGVTGSGAAIGATGSAAGAGTASTTGAGSASITTGSASGSGTVTATGSGSTTTTTGQATGAGTATTTGAGTPTAAPGQSTGSSASAAPTTGTGSSQPAAATATGTGSLATNGDGDAATDAATADGFAAATTTGTADSTGDPGQALGIPTSADPTPATSPITAGRVDQARYTAAAPDGALVTAGSVTGSPVTAARPDPPRHTAGRPT